MRRIAIVLCSAASSFHSAPAFAWACPGPPAAKLESPRHAEAPLNARLRVRFWTRPSAADLRDITLRSDDGVSIPFEATGIPENPKSPLMELVPPGLEPNTRYSLAWRVSPNAARKFPAPAGAEIAIGSFTTGSSEDHVAPVMPSSWNAVFVDRG